MFASHAVVDRTLCLRTEKQLFGLLNDQALAHPLA
jgi:hypothetical protein